MQKIALQEDITARFPKINEEHLKMSIKDNVYVAGEKPFDIAQHEWSDNCISVERSNTDAEQIRLDNDMYLVDIERKDAIAIAKHFKLTAEDLK